MPFFRRFHYKLKLGHIFKIGQNNIAINYFQSSYTGKFLHTVPYKNITTEDARKKLLALELFCLETNKDRHFETFPIYVLK